MPYYRSSSAFQNLIESQFWRPGEPRQVSAWRQLYLPDRKVTRGCTGTPAFSARIPRKRRRVLRLAEGSCAPIDHAVPIRYDLFKKVKIPDYVNSNWRIGCVCVAEFWTCDCGVIVLFFLARRVARVCGFQKFIEIFFYFVLWLNFPAMDLDIDWWVHFCDLVFPIGCKYCRK